MGSSKKANVGETLVTVLLLNSFYSIKLQLTKAVFVSAVVKKKKITQCLSQFIIAPFEWIVFSL